MKINAKVNKVFTRQQGKNTFYSLCLDHTDPDTGKDIWVGTGRNKPACNDNDVVTVVAEKNDRGYWEADAADVKVGAKAGPTAVASKGGWNDPDRQRSIVAQSSLKMAIDFVAIAVQAGALSLGSAKAKASDKYDILSGAVLEKATEFFDIGTNPDEYLVGEPSPVGDVDDDDDNFSPVGE